MSFHFLCLGLYRRGTGDFPAHSNSLPDRRTSCTPKIEVHNSIPPPPPVLSALQLASCLEGFLYLIKLDQRALLSL